MVSNLSVQKVVEKLRADLKWFRDAYSVDTEVGFRFHLKWEILIS
jgi:hypothetical protein